MSVFKHLRRKVVDLEFTGKTISVADPSDLEPLLKQRLSPSANAVTRLLESSDAILKQRAQDYVAIARLLMTAIGGDDESVARTFQQLEPGQIPQDHAWPELISKMAHAGAHGAELKRMTLTYYLQYLAATHDLIEAVQKTRARQVQAAPPPADGSDGAPAARQKLCMDELFPKHEFVRLVKGETVEIAFHNHQVLEIRLSRHPFLLIAGDPYRLIDDTGADFTLKQGKNVVGRNDDCDVLVEGEYSSISRRHALIDINPGAPVRITDLSSHGTFVPAAFAENLPNRRLH